MKFGDVKRRRWEMENAPEDQAVAVRELGQWQGQTFLKRS